jgi:hypothetical protein
VIVGYVILFPEQVQACHDPHVSEHNQEHVKKARPGGLDGRNCVEVVAVGHVVSKLPLHGFIDVEIVHQELLF